MQAIECRISGKGRPLFREIFMILAERNHKGRMHWDLRPCRMRKCNIQKAAQKRGKYEKEI